ncbi:hypothetical protein KY285_011133 [Solanum tuberosum]|nr:hypothetical protein KY289_011706 [Solanum tuberosum]KAH0735426.1 hypothetical protein KY285_011133 [Solanum tuberosum]
MGFLAHEAYNPVAPMVSDHFSYATMTRARFYCTISIKFEPAWLGGFPFNLNGIFGYIVLLSFLDDPNGPETLRKDSPPRGNVVVLMFGIDTPNLVPVINGERGSIQLMGRSIVGHDGIPKFNNFRSCEEDMFHVLAMVATHLAARVDV